MLLSELCGKFSTDMNAYLESKLPKLPACTKMEISEFLSNKVGNLMLDMYAEIYNELKRQYDKSYDFHYRRYSKKENDDAKESNNDQT